MLGAVLGAARVAEGTRDTCGAGSSETARAATRSASRSTGSSLGPTASFRGSAGAPAALRAPRGPARVTTGTCDGRMPAPAGCFRISRRPALVVARSASLSAEGCASLVADSTRPDVHLRPSPARHATVTHYVLPVIRTPPTTVAWSSSRPLWSRTSPWPAMSRLRPARSKGRSRSRRRSRRVLRAAAGRAEWCNSSHP